MNVVPLSQNICRTVLAPLGTGEGIRRLADEVKRGRGCWEAALGYFRPDGPSGGERLLPDSVSAGEKLESEMQTTGGSCAWLFKLWFVDKIHNIPL